MKLLSWERFGTKTLNHDGGISVQPEDLPLSEGFHWEAIPGSPSGTTSGPCISLSSQPPDIAQTQPEADAQGASGARGLLELPSDSKQDGKGVAVKEEDIQSDKMEDFAELSSVGTMKRKSTTVSK